jgi:ferric-dicitrate binding protein FerR (iron transport regulator)
VVRRLWGRDKGGRFRTHGHNSTATVRGTRWLTEDRCDGTLTKVTSGAVDVRPRHGRQRVRRVKAGHSVFVRAVTR